MEKKATSSTDKFFERKTLPVPQGLMKGAGHFPVPAKTTDLAGNISPNKKGLALVGTRRETEAGCRGSLHPGSGRIMMTCSFDPVTKCQRGSTMSGTRRDFLIATATIAAASSFSPAVYASPAKDDWIELFDGKSLKGWHVNPQKIGHGTGGQWQVENGTITGQQDPPGSGNGGILLTDRQFGDFEVEIDMKPDWGVCSGFFLRGNDRGQCIQMMVDYHDNGNVGHLYGEGTGGWNTRTFDINGKYDNGKLAGMQTAKHRTAAEAGLVSSCTPEAWGKAWKVGEWNRARVKVIGKFPQVTTWINGLQVCQFDGETSQVAGYDRDKVSGLLGPRGRIAVQVHGGGGWPKGSKCRWKNIRIREL